MVELVASRPSGPAFRSDGEIREMDTKTAAAQLASQDLGLMGLLKVPPFLSARHEASSAKHHRVTTTAC